MMFLISQIGLSLLFACLIGGLIGAAWRGQRMSRKRADFQETMHAVESRHSEQLAFFSAGHENSLLALEQARRDIAESLDRTREEATSVQVKLVQRDQHLKELSTALLKAHQDQAKAETTRRTLLQERQRAREEADVLRKQVATARAELVQMLGLQEDQNAQQARQLAAAHEERDLLLERMQQMVSLLQKAQVELEQRTAHLVPPATAPTVSPDAQETVQVPLCEPVDAPRRVA